MILNLGYYITEHHSVYDELESTALSIRSMIDNNRSQHKLCFYIIYHSNPHAGIVKFLEYLKVKFPPYLAQFRFIEVNKDLLDSKFTKFCEKYYVDPYMAQLPTILSGLSDILLFEYSDTIMANLNTDHSIGDIYSTLKTLGTSFTRINSKGNYLLMDLASLRCSDYKKLLMKTKPTYSSISICDLYSLLPHTLAMPTEYIPEGDFSTFRSIPNIPFDKTINDSQFIKDYKNFMNNN